MTAPEMEWMLEWMVGRSARRYLTELGAIITTANYESQKNKELKCYFWYVSDI